ncbi:MAG: signal peptide peptidase SppA [Bacteroidales bacterium]|nr:signal peptide peptidase SppA [Bacteroidales bacterium]
MENKPLSFGKTMLASALGVVIVSLVSGLLMFIMMMAMVVSIGTSMDDDSGVLVKNGTFLTVDLSLISGDRTASGLMQGFGNEKTVGLVDAMQAIRNAADDSKIKGLLIKDNGAPGISWASLEELRDVVTEFRESGKPVVAYATSYSQPGYYLASASDMVSLHPSGMVDFRGIGSEVMYYKDLLDKLGVEMQLIRPESCSYKSAGEVYTLSHMSPANREQIRAYIGSIWGTAIADIAASRNMSAEVLNKVADDLSGFMADDACTQNLVDTLCFEEDVRAMLKERYEGKQLLALEKYAKNKKKADKGISDCIAVIYAQGNVMDGSSKGFDEGVYGDDIVKSLRKAMNDDDVKAIVLRVNSPGGQATASESMTHAVMQAKAKKPVVVSMGDLAASAGYEMSCMADVIVAQPMTITGSIGVFGTIPSVQKLMQKKLGLNSDTVSTNRNANGLTIFRPLSPAAMALMTKNVEDFYKVFVGRVAEGRNMTFDEVHKIARGRVWTGADAVKIGLVDTLGGMDLALRIAAEKAGITDYKVKNYPEEKDSWTQLSEFFSGDSDDDMELSLLAKYRLARQWKSSRWAPLSRVENDLLYISTAEGLQARLPFIMFEN